MGLGSVPPPRRRSAARRGAKEVAELTNLFPSLAPPPHIHLPALKAHYDHRATRVAT